MNEKYKVAAYLRLSQEDGDKDVSDSIVSQKNIIEKKVEELGKDFFIVDYYIDDGYTGLNTNRPGFQRMIGDIEKGFINCIITKDLSRLSRNNFEANYFIELYFLERNIRYISVLDNVDTGTKNSNNDMIQFKTLINDWYSKDISKKIKSSLWARKEKGNYVSSMAPYGYQKSSENKNKLVINSFEAKIVKRIFEEYSMGNSLNIIMGKLKKDKIPRPMSYKYNEETRYDWSKETINRMLENKVYLGHTEYGKRINLSYKSKKVKYIPKEQWKIAYNTHEPIVTEELFKIVQDMRKMNKKIKRKKYEWDLNGLVNCKECGSKMSLKIEYKKENKNEIKSKKLYCLNGIKKYIGKHCIRYSKGLNELDLNIAVCKNLKNILSSSIKEEKLKELIRNSIYKNSYKIPQKQLMKKIKKKEDEISKLYVDYQNKILDEEDYKKIYSEKKEEVCRIKKEMQMLESKDVLDEGKLNKIVQEILKLKNFKKEIITSLVDSIQIDKDNQIYIYYKFKTLQNA